MSLLFAPHWLQGRRRPVQQLPLQPLQLWQHGCDLWCVAGESQWRVGGGKVHDNSRDTLPTNRQSLNRLSCM